MGLFDWLLKRKRSDMFIEWNDKYSVKIIEIDAQHKRLFEIFNNLVDAMYKGVGIRELGNALDELLEYSVLHFMTEEGYMEKYRYPELEQHRQAHREFRDRFYRMHKEFHEGKPVLTADVIDYLRDWIKGHVLNVDQRYSAHLIREGAR